MEQIVSRKRASAICTALLLAGLALVVFLKAYWPGLILAIGIPVALREFLLGRRFDGILSLVIFGGVFVSAHFEIGWTILVPILFILGAIYILLREFQESKEHPEDMEDEDINHEIEESSEDKEI